MIQICYSSFYNIGSFFCYAFALLREAMLGLHTDYSLLFDEQFEKLAYQCKEIFLLAFLFSKSFMNFIANLKFQMGSQLYQSSEQLSHKVLQQNFPSCKQTTFLLLVDHLPYLVILAVLLDFFNHIQQKMQDLPDFLCSIEVLNKIKKRLVKMKNHSQNYHTYYQLTTQAYSTFLEPFQNKLHQIILESQRLGLNSYSQIRNLFICFQAVLNFLKNTNKSVKENLQKAKNKQQSSYVVEHITKWASNLHSQLMDYKQHENQFKSFSIKCRRSSLSIENLIQEYSNGKNNPIKSYNTATINQFRQKVQVLCKQLANKEIKLNHDSDKMQLRKAQLTKTMSNFRNKSIQAMLSFFNNLINTTNTAVQNLRFSFHPSDLMANQKKRNLDLDDHQGQLQGSSIQSVHFYYHEKFNKISQEKLHLYRQSLKFKKDVSFIFIWFKSQVLKLRKKLIEIMNSSFGANKITKFQINIKSYFGNQLFQYYEHNHSFLLMPLAILQIISRIIQSKEEDLNKYKEIIERQMIKLEAGIKELSIKLRNARQQYSYSKQHDKSKKSILLKQQVENVDAELRILLNQFKVKQQLNLFLLCKVYHVITERTDHQVKNHIANIRPRKLDILNPYNVIQEQLKSHPRKKDILFHPFFQAPFSKVCINDSQKYLMMNKQLVNGLTLYSDQDQLCCFGCKRYEQRPLKSYKCFLKDNIPLFGYLQVLKDHLKFRSSFNADNLFFSNTNLLIPKAQILKLFKNQANSSFQLSLRIHTISGIIQFTSFFRRDKAFQFIKKQFNIDNQTMDLRERERQTLNANPMHSIQQQNLIPLRKSRMDQFSIGNMSFLGSHLTKQTSGIQQIQHEIAVPEDTKISDFLLHQYLGYLGDQFQIISAKNYQGDVLSVQYRRPFENSSYLINQRIRIVKDQDRYEFRSKICSEIVKVRLKQTLQDSFLLISTLNASKLTFWIKKQIARPLFTYQQGLFIKQNRMSYLKFIGFLENKFGRKMVSSILQEIKQQHQKQEITPRTNNPTQNFYILIPIVFVLIAALLFRLI